MLQERRWGWGVSQAHSRDLAMPAGERGTGGWGEVRRSGRAWPTTGGRCGGGGIMAQCSLPPQGGGLELLPQQVHSEG